MIDAVDRETLLLEDAQGRAYTVGILEAATIHGARVRVYRGTPLVSSTYRLDVSGRLVRDLIDSLPRGARRVYVTAALELKIRGQKRALATMCIGVGQGISIALEAV